MLCIYCQKECKNLNSLKNHERLCPKNKDRVYISNKTGKAGGNQFTKAEKLGLPKPIVKAETIQKSLDTKEKNGSLLHTEETKEKISKAMKLAVARFPESYTSSNRGRTKQIIVDGIKFQGKWELKFYEWCKTNGINVCRSNEWFPYEWNGTRKYFPDFYLPDYDLYIEVKGYETDRDRAKWRDFPKVLKVIKKDEMKLISENRFTLR